ncbi:alanine/glycine:cation symporter family protein [Corynebacterium heidelbergense]|uniref:Sodium:alanine symporter family protein n=1 Tax=Corynebacterium heidelbergense TaxID=2055947 RepID=A0A364VB29_9CORY|nr:alanine/glycine:cation symporter family protein [Corynebacterium heidelbergense]RAV33808.1 sodium:alanine symporter family protein [Corynebacterium heidelbergense]
METAQEFLSEDINGVLWKIIPFLLLGAGLYFGIRTLLVQIRYVPDMFRSITERPPKDSHKDEISPFKAFSISAASRVGTGNVAGVAIAISLGGPGAVFWMWVVAVVGGATAFVEATLAQVYKTRDGKGFRGGPAYYMTRGLRARPLAIVFAVAISITYGFVYNAVQTNSIVESMGTSLQVARGQDSAISTGTAAGIGLVIALLSALVIFGGVQRIANVTQWIVPFMAGAYILLGVFVLGKNVSEIPNMFATIVGHALGFKEVAGAAVGYAFSQGMRRGLFSNEAGQGSAPNAAATASVSHPVKQGLVQTLGVYFDTLVVCSITAFIILLSNPTYGGEVEGVSLTQSALAAEVGPWGTHLITFVLFFLAFSSILGNYYLAQANIQYFSNSPTVMRIFRVLVILCVFGGAIGTVPLVWALADTFAATMVTINLIAIIPLGGVAFKLLGNYAAQRHEGKEPIFHRSDLPELRNVECWDGEEAMTRREFWEEQRA